MTEADAKRTARRKEAIQMRLKREARLAAEFAKLPASVKRRKVRRYGRSKAKLHIDEYLQKVVAEPPPRIPPMFFPPTWPEDKKSVPKKEVVKKVTPAIFVEEVEDTPIEPEEELPVETVVEAEVPEEPEVKEPVEVEVEPEKDTEPEPEKEVEKKPEEETEVEPEIVKTVTEPEIKTDPIVKPLALPRKPIRNKKFPIDVLLLSTTDYGCVGHLYAESLKSVGINAVAVADKVSKWRAPADQGLVANKSEIRKLVEKSHILIWMHSLHQHFPAEMLKGKRLIVFHGGTRYRRGFKKLNARFNPIVEQCLIQTGELLGKGAKNARWILPPVDTEDLKPNYTYRSDGVIVIGHYSSHIGGPGTKQYYSKGSGVIDDVMGILKKGKFGRKFVYTSRNPSLRSWREHLRRLEECDIYIESVSQGQKEHTNKHDWSLAALEAAALGCVVVTNFVHEQRYEIEYGTHGLMVANNAAQLKAVMLKLLQMGPEELFNQKYRARMWVEEMHSFKAVGSRLKSMLTV